MQWFEEFPRARLSLKLCVFRRTVMKYLDVVLVNAMLDVCIRDAAASEALQFIGKGSCLRMVFDAVVRRFFECVIEPEIVCASWDDDEKFGHGFGQCHGGRVHHRCSSVRSSSIHSNGLMFANGFSRSNSKIF